MSSRGLRGGSRGGARGARAGRGGRGGSLGAATGVSPIASIESGSNDVVLPGAPASGSGGAHNPRAITIDSTQSNTPTPAPSSASASAARSRFKPKNVRRTEAERKKLEEERSRELNAKIKMEEREQRDADRRARRGRGRGDGAQRGGIVRRLVPDHALGENGRHGGGYGGYGRRYMDTRENTPRINVEDISGFYKQDESYRDSSNALPVSIPRVEHEDPEIQVAANADLETEDQDDDSDIFVDNQTSNLRGVQIRDDNEVWHAAPKKAQVRVKAEPGTEEADAMDIDNIPAKPESPSSPPKPRMKPVADMPSTGSTSTIGKKKKLDPEEQIAADDAAALLRLLNLQDSSEGDESGNKSIDGQLYLFQFPPIMPPLYNPNKENVEGPEGGNSAASKATPGQVMTEGGIIGKMNVRRSGKVELDWGGMIFEVGIGMEVGFPTSAMMIDENQATGMGQIYGKMVAVPRFGEEEDWDPSLEGIDELHQ